MSGDLMGKLVVRVSASDPDHIFGMGECIGYMGEPTYLIQEKDREGAIHWAQSITRAATAAEEIEYWKQRALAAESVF